MPTDAVRVVVGVAGGTGAGKSLLVNKIVERLGADRVACIQHDSYYRDRGHLSLDQREHVNYDHPDALDTPLLVEHIRHLKENRFVEVPRYDFSTHTRSQQTIRVEPKPAIIVEGILVLADQALRNLMDIRVFLDVEPDRRILRRLERDMKKRERTFSSVVQQYLGTVRPMHLEFVDPSKRHAHIIVPEGGRNTVALEMLIAQIAQAVSYTA